MEIDGSNIVMMSSNLSTSNMNAPNMSSPDMSASNLNTSNMNDNEYLAAHQLDMDDFDEQVTTVEDNIKANLLFQLPSYELEKTEYFIDSLKAEYNQQLQLNTLLKSSEEVVESNIQKIIQFTDKHDDDVARQLNDLNTLSEDLRNIINENNIIRKDSVSLNEVKNNEKYIKMIDDIKEIKKVRNDIQAFLDKQKIVTPYLY